MPGTDPFPQVPLPQPPRTSPTLVSPELRQVLEGARAAGFLGPGPIEAHLRHAAGFAAICRRLWPDGATPPILLDLGSGGGLPGLVVATEWPQAPLVLLDAQGRRTAFLNDAVRRLGFQAHVSVRQARAEAAGRDPSCRGHFDGVLARSFGRPAVVAECAAPLLKTGGWLIVSEPPGGSSDDPPPHPPDLPGASRTPSASDARWPAEPLRQLGLIPGQHLQEEFVYQTLRQARPCPDRFPRRDGVPAKRPLF